MATDNSPPRNGLILGIAVASVVTLGGLKFVFDSYYRYMMEDEIARKSAPPTELRAARMEEQQRLSSGPMPIDKAMKDFAKERESIIQPQASNDDGPLVGWSKTPRNVPAGAAALSDAGADAATGDGGALAASVDGGAVPNAADGGAHSTGTAPHASSDAGSVAPAPGGHAPQGPQDKLQGTSNPPNVSDAGGGKKP